MKYIITGSAPIKMEVLDYLKVGLGVNIFEAYGLTETCGPISVTRKINNSSGHVGDIIPGCLVRLKDHAELG